jgi:DNA-binding NarL/FixJ family response regulator
MRILVADNHEVVRRGLRCLLEARGGWAVCAECSSGREAVESAVALAPDVAILDVAMPELDGLEAARRIRRARPATATIIYSVDDTEKTVRDVLIAGASGYVAKSASPAHLVSAIESIHGGSPFVVARSFDGALRTAAKSSLFQAERALSLLSSREREVVQLLAEGRNNKEVGMLLGISARTVESHRSKIMRKLHVASFVGIVRYAIRNRLVEA